MKDRRFSGHCWNEQSLCLRSPFLQLFSDFLLILSDPCPEQPLFLELKLFVLYLHRRCSLCCSLGGFLDEEAVCSLVAELAAGRMALESWVGFIFSYCCRSCSQHRSLFYCELQSVESHLHYYQKIHEYCCRTPQADKTLYRFLASSSFCSFSIFICLSLSFSSTILFFYRNSFNFLSLSSSAGSEFFRLFLQLLYPLISSILNFYFFYIYSSSFPS